MATSNDEMLSEAHNGRGEMRRWELEGLKLLGPAPESLEEYWIEIAVADGWKSKTKVIRPKTILSDGKQHPLIVYYFGGGFSSGSPDQVTRPGREWAETFGAVVALPDYRLAPENSWPVSFKDGWDVLKYLSENAERELGATLDGPDGGFIVGGVSAGGSIAGVATAINMWGLEDLAKPFTGAFLCVPFFLTDDIVPEEYLSIWSSRDENRHDENLTTANVDQVVKQLGPIDKTSPWFSPINTARKGKPKITNIPVYTQVCQKDPIRDDAIIFDKILAGHGVPTKIDLFVDDGHASWTTLDYPTKSKNPTIEEATISGMKWLLKK